MRKQLALIPATLLLASCGAADAEPTTPVEPAPQATPVTHYSDSELSTPPAPGFNTITITASSSTPGEAHWGDVDTGNITELPPGATWTETIENTDATEYWDITVLSDMTGHATTTCTIKVDGQTVSEDVVEGENASSHCSVGDLSF